MIANVFGAAVGLEAKEMLAMLSPDVGLQPLIHRPSGQLNHGLVTMSVTF